MSHTSGKILLHLIFSTEQRRPLIKPAFQNKLFAYLGGIVREMRGVPLIINGMPDHVHMLIRIRPAQSAAQIVRTVKTNSSRWLHENGQRNFAWQTGYGVFSVSESNIARSHNTLQLKKNITKSIHSRKNSSRFLKRTTSPTTKNIFGINFLTPLRG